MLAPSAALDLAAGRALDWLERLVRVSSPSSDRQGLECCARTLLALGAELGLEGRIEEFPEGPVVQLGAREARAPLLALGHLDTVLAASPPRREGDRFFATGAIDMKGGFAALFGALELVRATGRALPPDLLVVAVPDEEIGGPRSVATTRHFGARARELWVLEPGTADTHGREGVVIGRRGLVDWTVTLRGSSAHAGNAFWEGRSALLAAAELAIGAAALSQAEAGSTVNPARLVAAEAGTVDDPAELVRLLGTCHQANVVPDLARLDGEARFATAADGEQLVSDLRDLVATVAATREQRGVITFGELVPPLEVTPSRLARGARLIELAQRVGVELVLEDQRGGVSFPSFLPPDATIPVLDGLGPAGDGMHTRDEFLLIPSLRARIAVLAEMIAEEGSRSGDPDPGFGILYP